MGVRPAISAHFKLFIIKTNNMTTINYGNEFKTTFVINSDTIPYMKDRGIQILECKPYNNDESNYLYSEITIICIMIQIGFNLSE